MTSKFGLPRPQRAKRSFHTYGRAIARLALSRSPTVKARLVRAAQGKPVAAEYGADEMSNSLRASLQELRLDRLDLFLLHEIEQENLTEELKRTLERAIADGFVGAWGIGSDRHKIDKIVRHAPSLARVLQFEWSVLSREAPHYSNAFVITHRALSTAYSELRLLLLDQERCRSWSNEVGMDLSDEKTLSVLMLAAALNANQGGIVLFSSNRPARIRANASALQMLSNPAVGRLVELVNRYNQEARAG